MVGLCRCSGFSPVATEWGLLSSCGAWAAHRGGLSRGTQALGHVGFSGCSTWVDSCSSWAQQLWRRGFRMAQRFRIRLPKQEIQETQFPSLGGEDPLGRTRQPTPGLSPRESHGQRSLVGYGPEGCKESDTTEAISTHPWTWLSCGMWDLPRPGIKPMSPTGASGFFTTEPPGKPWDSFLELVRPVREGSFQQSRGPTHCRRPGTQGTRGCPQAWRSWPRRSASTRRGAPAGPLPAQTDLGDRGSLRGE